MALKSNREGLRNELVDYLGNIIIDKKLRQDIINSINDVYVNESDVLTLEEIQASSDLTGKIVEASALKINAIVPTNIRDTVSESSFFRYGNIVFGRFNFSYSTSNINILYLPAPLVNGYYFVTDWNSGTPIDGFIYMGRSGECTYTGSTFTGIASCLLMYICVR